MRCNRGTLVDNIVSNLELTFKTSGIIWYYANKRNLHGMLHVHININFDT